ncbi:hypothetical protein EW026_g1930 [Hermanssonia centrifuga]|uniref:DUF8191 domain-containing protein n=1 Tax=Hermanssonia centrifuga TaxID=98765 RepID=A0A4S4KPV3_9APHY|nr:hypothetical protein EW026_g1930 [Hermanssonia centrifuga]
MSHILNARPTRASENVAAAPIDRGRKLRHRPQSRLSEDVEVHVTQDTQSGWRYGKNKKKDRSQSREAPQRLSRKVTTPEPLEEEQGSEKHYSGAFAAADFARMREELDTIKKHFAIAKKTINRQSKVIDDLRRDLATTQKSHCEQSRQVEKLQSLSKKSNEIISTVESNLTCQICMEMMLKPYGYVSGLHCDNRLLTEWFRAAPPSEQEMYDDDFPDALLYRKKSCPVCRATVLSRPIPLFLVKALVAAVEKSKTLPGASPRRTPPPDDDPWAGIFPDMVSSDDDWSGDDNDEDEDTEGGDMQGDEEDNSDYDDEDRWSFDGYGTDDDDEPYGGEYVESRWAPPTVDVSPDDYPYDDLTDEHMSMLRRGATMQMIELFTMTYSHEDGLKAIVDGNEIFLGYNIALHSDDETGEEYMDWVVADIYERPERWGRIDDDGEGFVASRLAREDEDEEYNTTDSEVWAADLASHDDFLF